PASDPLHQKTPPCPHSMSQKNQTGPAFATGLLTSSVAAASVNSGDRLMNILKFALVGASSLALLACNQAPTAEAEQNADALEAGADDVRENADATADVMEDKADDMDQRVDGVDSAAEQATEDRAQAVREQGEAKADAMENKAEAVRDPE
ncbi:hypothetical protein, partial [Porphyrobacter sp. TH134]|uniref:hypothetical protein n=1 Tax=Porphyrobacter sp. TH134 TaxID=2067450 RepID=UPI001F3B210C